MAYVDNRLSDVRTWDDVKTALGLRTPTIKKLQATDPHTPAQLDPNDPEKLIPAGHLVWNEAGMTTSDARQLWQMLAHEGEDVADEGEGDGTSSNNDPALDRNAPEER